MDYTYKEFSKAWRHARDLNRQYFRAQGAKDRAEIRDALELLFHGHSPAVSRRETCAR
jgi:hypothetical protein